MKVRRTKPRTKPKTNPRINQGTKPVKSLRRISFVLTLVQIQTQLLRSQPARKQLPRMTPHLMILTASLLHYLTNMVYPWISHRTRTLLHQGKSAMNPKHPPLCLFSFFCVLDSVLP